MADPVKSMGPMVDRLQVSMLIGISTLGVGLMVAVKVSGDPAQPKSEGVTVMMPVTGILEKLLAVCALIWPFPLAGSPFAMLLLVQKKLVPK